MVYFENKESEKFVYTDFVRDMCYDDNIPYIQFTNEYTGQEIVKLCCTQHTYASDYQRRKITEQWIDFLNTNQLPLKEVQCCTMVTQNVFDALCNQENIESLRIKWLRCKDIHSISKLINLKKLFIENGPSIEDISPIAQLSNLEVLILGSTKKVRNYDALAKLKKLKVFIICSYQTRDNKMIMENDSFIKEMTNLEYINLDDVKVIR